MRRMFIVCGIILLIQFLSVSVFAQRDKLAGRWEGKVQSPQGEQPATLIFKREGEAYTGKMTGLRPDLEIQLKEIKIEENKVTAKADVDLPQAAFTINFNFKLEGEAMNGQGSLNFNGQDFTFDVNRKRVSDDTRSQTEGQPQQRPRNPSVPQPQQKQSIDYFVGQWSYKYVGRESALGPVPRDCTVSFTKRSDGKSVEGVTDCTYDGGGYKETSLIVFDEASKMLTYTEKLGSGITLQSRGDWTSPISIRFTIDPVKVKGQTLQLRRTISVVAAHSFTIAEELSEDGGPFIRLGNAVVTR